MGLFKPEIGLVFWMLVVFLIILAILAKYAWPVIIRSIEQRADFIDSGVKRCWPKPIENNWLLYRKPNG